MMGARLIERTKQQGTTTPQAVLWDMDGTLIDSEPLHERSLEVVLEEQGIVATQEVMDLAFGRSSIELYKILQAHYGLKLTPEEWMRRKYAYFLSHVTELRPRESAADLFHVLDQRGVHQAIVSNSDRIIVNPSLHAVGIMRPLLCTVTRNDVRNGKPDPEPYQRAMWLLGATPTATIAIEDSLIGAQAGAASGATTFWCPQKIPSSAVELPSGITLISRFDDLWTHCGVRS